MAIGKLDRPESQIREQSSNYCRVLREAGKTNVQCSEFCFPIDSADRRLSLETNTAHLRREDDREKSANDNSAGNANAMLRVCAGREAEVPNRPGITFGMGGADPDLGPFFSNG
jgi:hypothetical protein